MNNVFGVAVDPTTGKLFVADRNNNRVLRFSSAAKLTSGAAAEAVLGQPDDTTNTSGLSAVKMSTPVRLFVDAAGRLWVSDYGNRRVLRFDGASAKATGAAADGVLGQPDFVTNTTGTTAAKMSRTTGIFVDGSGRLWVGERDNSRVLRFDNAAAKANGANADGVLGQPDFVTGTTGLSATKMNEAWGVYVDAGGRLWVADDANNRVLRFDGAAAKANGAAANGVLGQPDFTTNSSPSPTQSGMSNVRGVFGDAVGRIYTVEEFANNRILVFNNAANLANGANADNVLGQANFLTGTAALPPTVSSFSSPNGIYIDNANNQIWIADAGNNRVLRFDVTIGGPTTGVNDRPDLSPTDYALAQNYPNPFNPGTTITFALKTTERATVTVYNLLGQTVATLFDGVAKANERYSLSFNASNLPSGVYFYALRSATRNEAKKMVLMK
jgi:streptogramin lyase